ncbi:GEVED domain-containing protein [Thalassomonas actiniarum]|uniref:PKD domain-containing protein n=1 Tax=Thalassomonas actiniarum TaxID=485447 RepID=A0AAF0C4U8_9GAMM|nr:GEVED domain-containing protein [Thalassomonas actiniarum]WDE02637.1 PKD domain-containing protein [Thalassomonas actiniarum]
MKNINTRRLLLLTALSSIGATSHATITGGLPAPVKSAKTSLAVNADLAAAATYCTSTGGGDYEYIARVEVANLDNTSTGVSPYTDFTALTANLVPGANAITLTPGFVNNAYTEHFAVYIDFNQDGDFTDSGENVMTGSGNSAVNGTIEVPANVSGNTRMRVLMKYNQAVLNPCENIVSGEVEDYSVSLGGSASNQPPTAVTDGPYSGDIGAGIAMNSNGSSDSDGNIVSWLWDFGDGNSSTSANPNHVYHSAGSYTVTLTVTDDDGASASATTSVTINDGSTNPTDYCAVSGGGSHEWIAGVRVGDLNNTSAQSDYADYTSQVAKLAKGANTITLTPGFSGNAYTEHWAVWIDFNKDGDFLDAGEQVISALSGNGAVNGTITVPETASGSTRMRIGMQYNQALSAPCSNVASGEFEDYTVSFDGVIINPPTGSLPDVCASQDPDTSGTLTDGVPVCVPASSAKQGFSISAYNVTPAVTSIAITTKHGLGNLSLEGRAGSWPSPGDDSVRSKHVGNTECVIITNPSASWNYVNLSGLFKGASVVADFNKTSCRETVGAPDTGNGGYDYDHVNLIIFPFDFPGSPLDFTTEKINAEMALVKKYFEEQSYGNFTVTWEIKSKTTMADPKSRYDNDKNAWRPAYREKIIAAGVDPDFPGEATLVMVTAPKIGPSDATSINSQASPPLLEVYTHKGSTIAHEMGHSFGLHHARSVEAGNSIINSGNDTVSDYGNVFDLMGMGGHTFEEINLMFKSYFKGWLTDSQVPLVTSSGTYRIYAFDHGSASGTNNPGNIGIRLKSGDGKLTYWLEYRTTAHGEEDTPPAQQFRTPLLRNGVLVNVQDYMEQDDAGAWWVHISKLLDMTPNSQSTANWALEDETDAPLQIGKSFTDPWNGFRITPVAKGGTENTAQAWIEVEVEQF